MLNATEMMNNLRNHWASCLLSLLLLFAASKGAPLFTQDNTSWQNCKDVSQKIIQMLGELSVTWPEGANWNFAFPQKIDCSDSCDPDSLAKNKTHCLQKIRHRLHEYHKLLNSFLEHKSITDAVHTLLNLLPENTDVTEESSLTIDNVTVAAWESELFQKHILWHLQSFSIVMARVLAHSTALTANTSN